MARYLLSPAGLRQLRSFLGPDTVLAFDFDGTLAPIVPRPERAALPAATAELLERLSRKASVALISGRKVSDLKSRSDYQLLAWIGNHGMEGLPGRAQQARQAVRKVRKWKRALEKLLHGLPDVTIEDKTYSLTVHYRSSKRKEERRKMLLQTAGSLHPPPRILPGKCVLNLMMPGDFHKGTALRELLRGTKFHKAMFVGDDDTDEDVFRMQDPRILSVRVGRKRNSSAMTYLHNQKEMNKLLRLLLKSY
jgi:trehalose 6-phosphate phosphatase